VKCCRSLHDGGYARIQAEKIARQLGMDEVTADIINKTQMIYLDFIGEEKPWSWRPFYREQDRPRRSRRIFF